MAQETAEGGSDSYLAHMAAEAIRMSLAHMAAAEQHSSEKGRAVRHSRLSGTSIFRLESSSPRRRSQLLQVYLKTRYRFSFDMPARHLACPFRRSRLRSLPGGASAR